MILAAARLAGWLAGSEILQEGGGATSGEIGRELGEIKGNREREREREQVGETEGNRKEIKRTVSQVVMFPNTFGDSFADLTIDKKDLNTEMMGRERWCVVGGGEKPGWKIEKEKFL